MALKWCAWGPAAQVRGKDIPKPVRNWNQCGLSSRVLEVLRKAGYGAPMPIQAQALPAIMAGRDCLGIAKTGSGKTLAFVLPMLRHIKDQARACYGNTLTFCCKTLVLRGCLRCEVSSLVLSPASIPACAPPKQADICRRAISLASDPSSSCASMPCCAPCLLSRPRGTCKLMPAHGRDCGCSHTASLTGIL